MNATQDIKVVEGLPKECSGLVCFWRLSGRTEADTLCEAWSDAGLSKDLLPKLPTVKRAVRNALKDHSNKRTLVRPLESDGYALVNEDASEDTLEHEQDLTVKILNCSRDNHEIEFTPDTHPLADTVKDKIDEYLFELDTDAVSVWITADLIKSVQAIPLRSQGGAYYVPRSTAAIWRKYTKVISEVGGHTFYEIPALSSGEEVRAVLDALIFDTDRRLKKLMSDILDPNKAPGKRALESKIKSADNLAAGLEAYEELLGDRLAKVRERIVDAKVTVSAAILEITTDND